MGTIVCGVDDSPGSRDALRVAAELSGTLSLRLVLAHVARRTRPSAGLSPITETQARNRGDALLARICREHDVDDLAERRVEVGDCATELARIAREESASVLMVGSRASRALRRGVVGELAAELASTSACPVVVVPPRAPAVTRLQPSRANR
jgi:nucleotide-binding universal stress UspA family protein